MLALLSIALAVATDPGTDKPKPKKEKMVCRAPETTGSRMNTAQICKTPAQWEADAELTRKTIQFRQRREGM